MTPTDGVRVWNLLKPSPWVRLVAIPNCLSCNVAAGMRRSPSSAIAVALRRPPLTAKELIVVGLSASAANSAGAFVIWAEKNYLSHQRKRCDQRG